MPVSRVSGCGALRSVGMPLDVIVMRTDRFEETKNVVGGIAYPANKYGRVIYKAASRGGSVTGRLRRPSRMLRSSRHSASSTAIPGSMRRSPRTPPTRACRSPARFTTRSPSACWRMLGSSHAEVCKTSIIGSTPIAASNNSSANGHFPVVRRGAPLPRC